MPLGAIFTLLDVVVMAILRAVQAFLLVSPPASAVVWRARLVSQ
jgi:hypothetical protein